MGWATEGWLKVCGGVGKGLRMSWNTCVQLYTCTFILLYTDNFPFYPIPSTQIISIHRPHPNSPKIPAIHKTPTLPNPPASQNPDKKAHHRTYKGT